jgi:hypothetical protein
MTKTKKLEYNGNEKRMRSRKGKGGMDPDIPVGGS